MAKSKRKKYVFLRQANMATIGTFCDKGASIWIGSKTIKMHGLVYDRPQEISMFVRDGVVVPASNEKARQAAKVLHERLVVHGEDAKIRGMELTRDEDYVSRPIEARKTGKDTGRVDDASEKDVAAAKKEMSDSEVVKIDDLYEDAVDEEGNKIFEGRPDARKVAKALKPSKSKKGSVFIEAKPGVMSKDRQSVASKTKKASGKKAKKTSVKKTPDLDNDLSNIKAQVSPEALEKKDSLDPEIAGLVG